MLPIGSAMLVQITNWSLLKTSQGLAHTHRKKNALSFKVMLIGTKHTHSAHNNIQGQPQQTRYASSREFIISYTCLACITKRYGMRYNNDTAWQPVDNESTACTTCSRQILRVSTTLSQHINVPIQIYRQVSITKMNKPMHMHHSGIGWT